MPPSLTHFPRLRVLLPLALAALLAASAGCGSGGGAAPAAGPDSTEAQNEESEDDGPAFPYEIIVGGMLTDTLRGATRHGLVFDPVTRQQQWVLSMRSGGDVTSGVYLSRPDTTRPQSGTYEIIGRGPIGTVDSVRAGSPDSFTMIYRAGMRRSFYSQSGRLEITTSNDTLLEGNFRATLQGTASPPGQPPREGILDLEGEFRSEKRVVGFMFGI